MKISLFSIVFNVVETLPKDMFEINIENMYNKVDEIIIVEGATKAVNHYFDGDTSSFTSNGKSTDGTIDLLKRLEKFDKVKVVYSDGFWNGKTQMCNTASSLSTGDYIWQLDSDEFYKHEDIDKIKNILEIERPNAVHFFANHFFGGFDYCIDERSPNTWGNNIPWKRIFKHSPGKSRWERHEPPIYVCDGMNCDDGKIISREQTLSKGIKMYHYSYVQYEQILFKTKFFKNNEYPVLWEKFKNDKTSMIFDSNAYKFEGEHPDIIKKTYNINGSTI